MIELTGHDTDKIIKRLEATPKHIKAAHNRAVRVALRGAIATSRRMMRDHVDARSLKAIRSRFFDNKKKKVKGMMQGRIWVGFNPIPLKSLKGRPKKVEGGITFRDQYYARGFIIPIGGKKKALRRVNGKVEELSMDIDDELQRKIDSHLKKRVPELYIKEFERDLTLRVEGKIGKK